MEDGHKARMRRKFDALAERFDGDGTDRAMRIKSATEALDALGALDDLELSVTIWAMVWHVSDGLDPERHASERARSAAAHAVAGTSALRQKARELAAGRSDTTRAATVRAIWPALLSYRDVLRGMGYNVPNLNGATSQRTVSDWLKN